MPDLRGYGDSDLAIDDSYDIALYSRDLHTLMSDVLGYERFGVVARPTPRKQTGDRRGQAKTTDGSGTRSRASHWKFRQPTSV